MGDESARDKNNSNTMPYVCGSLDCGGDLGNTATVRVASATLCLLVVVVHLCKTGSINTSLHFPPSRLHRKDDAASADGPVHVCCKVARHSRRSRPASSNHLSCAACRRPSEKSGRRHRRRHGRAVFPRLPEHRCTGRMSLAPPRLLHGSGRQSRGQTSC